MCSNSPPPPAPTLTKGVCPGLMWDAADSALGAPAGGDATSASETRGAAAAAGRAPAAASREAGPRDAAAPPMAAAAATGAPRREAPARAAPAAAALARAAAAAAAALARAAAAAAAAAPPAAVRGCAGVRTTTVSSGLPLVARPPACAGAAASGGPEAAGAAAPAAPGAPCGEPKPTASRRDAKSPPPAGGVAPGAGLARAAPPAAAPAPAAPPLSSCDARGSVTRPSTGVAAASAGGARPLPAAGGGDLMIWAWGGGAGGGAGSAGLGPPSSPWHGRKRPPRARTAFVPGCTPAHAPLPRAAPAPAAEAPRRAHRLDELARAGGRGARAQHAAQHRGEVHGLVARRAAARAARRRAGRGAGERGRLVARRGVHVGGVGARRGRGLGGRRLVGLRRRGRGGMGTVCLKVARMHARARPCTAPQAAAASATLAGGHARNGVVPEPAALPRPPAGAGAVPARARRASGAAAASDRGVRGPQARGNPHMRAPGCFHHPRPLRAAPRTRRARGSGGPHPASCPARASASGAPCMFRLGPWLRATAV